jgi:hypothetical protein
MLGKHDEAVAAATKAVEFAERSGDLVLYLLY